MYVTSTLNICLEDLSTSRATATYKYLTANYNFNGAPAGSARYYYRSTVTSQTFDFYYGNSYPDVRIKDYEPHRSEANGLYFDGNDYLS
jgi:hypothetical protein